MISIIYNNLKTLLTKSEQKVFKKLIVYSVLMAFLESFSLAAVVPVTTILLDGEKLYFYLNEFFPAIDINYMTTGSIVIVVGLFSAFFFLISALFRSLVILKSNYFAQIFSATFSQRLLRTYLHQRYEYFLANNTSRLVKNTLSEVDGMVGSTLIPAINIISQFSVCIVLITLMTLFNPTIVFIVGVTLLVVYLLIFFTVRSKISSAGKRRVTANEARYKVATQILGGIKVVKCANKEETFLSNFVQPTLDYAASTALVQSASQIPRYIVEGLLLASVMLFITIASMVSGENFVTRVIDDVPIVLFFIFTILKLLPIFQALFHNITVIRAGIPSLQLLAEQFRSLNSSKSMGRPTSPVTFNEKIELRNLSISYDDQSPVAVQNVSLKIKKGETIGLVGPTGSGKTTLADALVGILTPQSGEILIDGVRLSDQNRKRWSKSVGYVPQDVYLLDADIAQNIAFGIEEDHIDRELMVECAKKANIHDHIMKRLEHGYASRIGERGVRLSGGQRQRIGIARALYAKSSLIIFDEATSALDTKTEKTVMQAISKLKGEQTIIIIAHRLNTLKACDKVVSLKNGQIERIGPLSSIYGDLQRK